MLLGLFFASIAACIGSDCLSNACLGMSEDIKAPGGGATRRSGALSGFKFGCWVRHPAQMPRTATNNTQTPHFANMGSFPRCGLGLFQGAEYNASAVPGKIRI